VLQFPGFRCMKGQALPAEQEFVAKENINFDKGKPVSKGVVGKDEDTMKTSNVSSPSKEPMEEPNTSTRKGPLMFNPSPPIEEDEEFQLATTNNQAKLMRWHYCLGHLSFPKLKLLAKNSEIPCCLAKVPPPKCTRCLFRAMTKLPWCGKKSKSSHKVFVTTKPGECDSIDHMVSTHIGFFAQLKGTITKKRYCAISIFVNHFSYLQFVHLMQDYYPTKQSIPRKNVSSLPPNTASPSITTIALQTQNWVVLN
jgi:hypothetical protein